MTYIIPADPEGLRRSMIAFHERLAAGARQSAKYFSRAQKDIAADTARMNVHLNMVDFWQHVEITSIPFPLVAAETEREHG